MEEKKINPKFNQNSFIPSNESNVFIINNNQIEIDKDKTYNIKENSKEKINEINNSNKVNTNIKDYELFDDIYSKYNSLFNENILGRFSILEKINIINKLNLILFNKIKRELQLQLKRKQLENELLKLKNNFKDNLIKQKKLYSLIQQKMLRDYNLKRKLKDLRKKLMDEKISCLRNKNLVYIMKTYGIYNENKNVR